MTIPSLEVPALTDPTHRKLASLRVMVDGCMSYLDTMHDDTCGGIVYVKADSDDLHPTAFEPDEYLEMLCEEFSDDTVKDMLAAMTKAAGLGRK